MKILLAGVCLTVLAAQAQPHINYRGVVNAASFAPPGSVGSSIARGSIFSIFGSNIGPATLAQVSAFPLPATLAGVSIKITQGSASVNAIPLIVTANQVNAIMPSNAPLGLVSIQLTLNGDISNPGAATVTAATFGTFAINSAGFGPGVMQNFVTPTSQPINALNVAAAPGQTITLYGTGLGAVPADNVAPTPGNLSTPVDVFVGGQSAPVLYSGRSPCCSGLDQIVFTVPANAPLGCYVPVQIRTNQTDLSNTVTMAVASSGAACSDARNPIEAAFFNPAKVGLIVLTRAEYYQDVDLVTPTDSGADLAEATVRSTPGGGFFFNPAVSLPPIGACLTNTVIGSHSSLALPDLFGALGAELDAGPSLTVSGLSQASIPRAATSPFYGAVLGTNDPVFGASTLVLKQPGTTTVSTAGGAGVGPLSVSVTAAPAISWTNRLTLSSIDRSQPLPLTWTPVTTPSNALMIVAGFNYDLPTNTQQSFACSAAAEAGSFAIPSYILRTLPASRSLVGQSTGMLLLGIIPGQNAVTFSASGLDTGFAVGISSSSKTVLFQ